MKAFCHITYCILLILGVFHGNEMRAQAQWEINQVNDYQIYMIDGHPYGEVELKETVITSKRPSRAKMRRGKKRLERYTRLKWHVHKVYPYAVKVSAILSETHAELAALPEGTRKKQYIKSKEKNLFGQYEKDIRKMSRTQGRILVKLIHRQTGASTFFLIKDMRSGATALFWQSISLIFGINLKTEYDADAEENWLIERYVQELEEGGYNLVYKSNNYSLR